MPPWEAGGWDPASLHGATISLKAPASSALQLASSPLIGGSNSLALVVCSGYGSLSIAAAHLGAAHPLPTPANGEDFIRRMMTEWVSMMGPD
jgi:ActR/RegA family two-component response regulator